MNKNQNPIYLFITADKTVSPEEINLLTKELGQMLAASKDEVGEISYVGRDVLPKGTKMAELVFAQQVIIQLIPIVTPWVLGKIDSAIKSISTKKQKFITSTMQVGSHEIHINPETTPQKIIQYKEILKSAKNLSNDRYALIIGNSAYSDKALPSLNSAELDAITLSNTLTDSRIGAFSQVTTLIDKDSHTILQAIENFFQNRQRNDLLLLYFSGHGVKTKRGQLFLAAQNTTMDLVLSTGISSSFIKENMDACNSQRQVLILDCCYSGAIIDGAKSEQIIGQPINSIQAFESSGFGRVIIAASEAMQFAYDGKQFDGQTENSLFTQHLIEGLQTGKADYDNDGLIDIEELYQYAYSNVVPKQTPNISTTSKTGKLYISINPNPIIKPAQLPEKLISALKSDDRLLKQGAISDLKYILKSNDSGLSMAAEIALNDLTNDDSLNIRNMAKEVLQEYQSSTRINQSSAYKVDIADDRVTNVLDFQYTSVVSPVSEIPLVETFHSQHQGKNSTNNHTQSVKLESDRQDQETVVSYAGFWKRFAAAFIDAIIMIIGLSVIDFIFGILFIKDGADDTDIEGFLLILDLVLGWLYRSVMESSPTQGTLGKMALGIKVTDLEGNKIEFGKASGRYLGQFVSGFMLGIGFIMVTFTEKKQALHDLMAGCLVVNK